MVFQTEQEKKEFMDQVNLYKENLMKGNKNLSEEEAILKERQAISSLTSHTFWLMCVTHFLWRRKRC